MKWILLITLFPALCFSQGWSVEYLQKEWPSISVSSDTGDLVIKNICGEVALIIEARSGKLNYGNQTKTYHIGLVLEDAHRMLGKARDLLGLGMPPMLAEYHVLTMYQTKRCEP